MFDFKLDWQPKMATGIDIIDSQHRQLLKVGRDIEQLLQINCIGVTDKQLLDIVCELRDYTGYHFYAEESLMEECSYTGQAEHKKAHQKFVTLVMGFDVKALKTDPVKGLTKIREVVVDLVFNHLLTEDQDFAREYRMYEKLHRKPEEQKQKYKDDCEDRFGPELADLDLTRAYLLKDQSYRGHAVIVNKEKTAKLLTLTALERNMLFADMTRVAAAIKKALQPDAIEFAYYEDIDQQLLWHIVPKYQSDKEYGHPFDMEAQEKELEQSEYQNIIQAIQKELR